MIPISKNIKLCIPGYRYLWKRRSQCFLDHLGIHTPLMSFGDDNGVPYLEHKEIGKRLYGFVTNPKSEDLFSLVSSYVPPTIPDTHENAGAIIHHLSGQIVWLLAGVKTRQW